MKLITSFTKAITLLFSQYLQATLLIIGLLFIDLGILTLLNVGSFLVFTGVSLIAIAFLINYERKEVKQ